MTFKASQYAIKKEIKRKIKKQVPLKDLAMITFSLAEIASINWEEKEKEFWHNGNLYDMVRKVEITDSITFYCINDRQEKILFANLEELINRQMNSESQDNNTLLKKFQTDYFFIPTQVQFTCSGFSELRTELQPRLLKGFFSESLQPPEQA